MNLEAVNSSNSQEPILKAISKVLKDDDKCMMKFYSFLKNVERYSKFKSTHKKMYVFVNGGEWEELNKIQIPESNIYSPAKEKKLLKQSLDFLHYIEIHI